MTTIQPGVVERRPLTQLMEQYSLRSQGGEGRRSKKSFCGSYYNTYVAPPARLNQRIARLAPMLDREAPTSSPSDPAPIEEAAAEGCLHLPREPVPLEMLPLPRAPGRYVGDVAVAHATQISAPEPQALLGSLYVTPSFVIPLGQHTFHRALAHALPDTGQVGNAGACRVPRKAVSRCRL